MPDDTAFARLVSLACHDVRTPLATVYGFARTLSRAKGGEQAARYVSMIEAASEEMAEILDALGVAARIEAGRWEPALMEADTLVLAQAAAEREPRIANVAGAGTAVRTDPAAFEGALVGLAVCAVRHGGIEDVSLAVRGAEIELRPVLPEAAAIVVAEDLRDLGAAVAVRVIDALGGAVSLDGDALVVRLPST